MPRFRPAAVRALLLCSALVAACGDEDGPTVTPPPTPDPAAVVPGAATGPTRITFVSASIPPGSTISGCGPLIEGCAGRLRMTFGLRSDAGGPVLFVRAFLHSTSLAACLLASSGPLELQPGVPALVEVAYDQSDRCGTPVTIATMAVVAEGPVAIASRQEWALRYTFAP